MRRHVLRKHDDEREGRQPQPAPPARTAPEHPAVVDPRSERLRPESMLRLQRLAGNAATGRVAQRAPDDQRPPGWTPSGPILISRLKESASPFSGAAGTADARAGQAAGTSVGIAPIAVDRGYAIAQAERKEHQMNAFRQADIPFVDDNMEHYGYKKLMTLRQEYIDDAPRINLAEAAFNDFAGPATLANKAATQFKAIQFELGYSDDMDPTEDLSAKQKKALAKGLDEKKLKVLNESVSNKESTTQGLRKEILGTAHNVQGAMQRRVAVLSAEARLKGEGDKAAIEAKIAAVKAGFETATTVVSTVSFAGFGGPAAIAEVAGGGATAIKGGLDLGEKGVGLVGGLVEFIMTERYKEDIQKAKQAIEIAKGAETRAKTMDAELSITGGMLQIEGQVDQLAGAMGELAAALRSRKEYFAELGAATDKASGGRSSGMSQYLAYVSQAMECKSHLSTALSSAGSAEGVLAVQNNAIANHRRTSYIDANGVWGNDSFRDPDGPDLEMLREARAMVGTFTKAANAQLAVIDSVTGSLPSPQ